ncbi:MAG: glycosyltransferase family 4 protein [Candidatus Woesearchaeota archaeon]
MRICVVSDFFVPHYNGGGERRYYEILKRLVKNGFEIDLICMKIKGVPNSEEIEGIHVHHIGPVIASPPSRNLLQFVQFVFAAFYWMIRRDYDVVEGHGTGLLAVSLVGKLKRAKSVAVIHDLSSGKADQWLGFSRLSELIEKLLIKLPYDTIINVSKGVKKRLVNEYQIDPKKIEVVHNGVDLDLVDSVEAKQEKYSIIYVGRLIPHKHVDDLIQAVGIIRTAIPDVKLKVIGAGQEMASLKDLVRALKLEKNVKFFGSLQNYEDVIKEIKKSSVLVLPSTREGFGMVLVEAFACRVPCVAYYSDGVVEVIDNGKNGYLVKQRDVKQLARLLSKILNDSNLAVQLGERGRSKTEKKFSWDGAARSLTGVYKNGK